MKRVIATLIAVIMIATYSVSAMAQSNYVMTGRVRVQSMNGTINQFMFVPSWKLTDRWSVAPIMLVEKSTEFSIGAKWSDNTFFVWPLVGMLYAPERDRGTYTQLSLHGGYSTPGMEITSQNMFDLATRNGDDGTFHRLWVQWGRLGQQFRIGAMSEVLTANGKQPLVTAGPRLSFFKDSYRLDFYAGKIMNDNKPAGGTPTTLRIWLWITI